MPPTRQCARCGAALSESSLAGVCPRCMLRTGMESVADQAGGAAVSSAEVPHASGEFGDYELLEEIARGGMGVVYRARQRSLNRTVAVKLILSGHFASAAFVQRFRAEAEAAATLQHPNIVAIHEVGQHQGQHYFSMDYVAGKNLAQLIADGSLRISDFRRAAHYLKTIAEAIHYAHERGVLHRDLKPSNVLIDEFDQPRITDFGLAKRLVAADVRRLTSQSPGEQAGKRESEIGGPVSGSPSPGGEGRGEDGHSSESERDQSLRTSAATELTITGQVLGSPNFMPPEQASGKPRAAGPWSDVYSLGAILYHLVTGRAPFQCETVQETLTQVAQADPVSPRLLNPSLPRDLETICLKCLEKEPKRRYQTAKELADELGRFLIGEPIRARPVGRPERFWRWCRRNPRLAVSFGSLALVFLLGFAGVVWQWQRAERQRERAESEAAKSRQVANFLRDMLEGVGPSVAMGRDTTILREILDKTAERVSKDLKYQPEVEVELRLTLAQIYHELGGYSQMEQMSREALRVARAHWGDANENVVDSLVQLGDALRHEGKRKEANEALRQAVAMAEKLHGGHHLQVARALQNLALELKDSSDLAGAEEIIRRALAITKNILGEEHPAVTVTLANLAAVLERGGNLAEAEELNRHALHRKKRALGEEHPEVAGLLNNLGLVVAKRGAVAEAEQLHRRALEIRRRILGEEHPHVADSLQNLANVLHNQEGKQAEAEALHREALAMRKKRFGPNHPLVAASLSDLAHMLEEQDKYEQAEPLLRELLENRRARHPADSDRVLSVTFRLGRSLSWWTITDTTDPERAAAHAREAEQLLGDYLIGNRRNHAARPERLESRIHDLAEFRYRQGQYSKAEPLYREIFQSRGARLDPTHEDMLLAAASLARLLAEWAWAERASKSGILNPKPEVHQRALEAEQLLRECLANRMRGTNATHWRTADVRSRLGSALVSVAVTDGSLTAEGRVGKLTAAESLLLEGNEVLQQSARADTKYKRNALERLARLYQAWDTLAPNTGQAEKAEAWKKKLAEFSSADADEPTVEEPTGFTDPFELR